MKNALIFILFLTVSFTGFAQQEVTVSTETEIVETVKEENASAKTINVSAEVKAKVLKMNRKKSNEIISIKAYRKSLQIKVKTVKLC
ncbi:hypothetical protein DFQ10_10366 [Winogradskyella eximia]|jgi:hypothetical protein|uniref:Uncharacterized protein n=1 Tax=Winogradskyella eximia TaxID=262006 RepID=A0A3D9H4E4_9FLAO|nr:hypothetical protein [Winogradskyella eximia]RED44384.1 hypothetical protein DFQ10_10366 [Winogradskyella eximia]|tara:strand:+ start:1022 stop:1282 length:261 start_codon:yes stop_codon:yes gene_type:complete